MSPSAEGLASGVPRGAALAALRRRFTAAGLDAAALDARILVAAALGVEAFALATEPDVPLGRTEAEILRGFAARRLAREPVARILGEREFWGLPFALSPETLVPRPDSETVVATALTHAPGRDAPLRVLDLGTGSGALLVALLHERPNASGLGVDRSTGALRTAQGNARQNGVGARALFAASDWAAAARPGFDLVVANPPYVRSGDLETLAPEVQRHDPAAALDGGPDGLDAYRSILGEVGRLLAPAGALVLEIGYDQEAPVRALAAGSSLAWSETARDLAGHPRALAFKPT